ncbi:MAG: hypothetical protein ABMA25_11090 [Ilumatobacteraceae bacterium]
MTDIVRSDAYEEPALDWLYAQVERLRAALANAGVVEEGTQRLVCEHFFFGLSVEFDDGEVVEQPRARRRLGFESDGVLLLPDDDSFDLHEYALGVVGEAFGDA